MKILLLIVLSILSVAGIIFLQFGFLLLLLALLPSIMAYIVDVGKGKHMFQVVFLCNFSAFMPTLSAMLRAATHMRHYDAMEVAAQPLSWLLYYSGAACGWGLIYLGKYLSRFIVAMNSQMHVAHMEAEQKKLVDEWGQNITKGHS